MYLLGVFRDITQRREAEEARRKIEAQKLVVEKLKELNRIKDEFVETVTHELRTPMTPLRSSVDLLLDGSLGDLAPQQKKYLEMMKRNIDRLSRFATEVLTFSKLESGSYKLHPREISVLSVVRTVTDLLKRKTTETDTSIGVEVRAESFAYADPDAVSEVITNLLANAIVHNPAGTHVRVSSRPVDEHFVEVSIADNGRGIPEDMLDRIFEKFFQAGRECGPGYRGIGIGLTVCKTLVEKMGGTISVQSRVSEGSIFKFTLPMKNPG
jgi:signal transduction histidine kinase